MNAAVRIVAALLIWCGAAAAGWWWHRPVEKQASPARAADGASAAAENRVATPGTAMVQRLVALDPMGLNRTPATPALPGMTAAAPTADAMSWRLSALVVRNSERYAVLIASGQPPLTLRVGDRLPDGDRIKSIAPDRINVASPRGRVRTLYLIEP